MLEILKTIFGLGQAGASVLNQASGVVNHLAFLPVIVYLVDHADKTISMNVTLGFLAVCAGVGYFVLELNRRLHP